MYLRRRQHPLAKGGRQTLFVKCARMHQNQYKVYRMDAYHARYAICWQKAAVASEERGYVADRSAQVFLLRYCRVLRQDHA